MSVIGAGSWGTTVAHLASQNGPTVLWSRRKDLADQINEEHENGEYLSGYRLHRHLRATSSMEEAVHDADVLVMGVPSHVFRETMALYGIRRVGPTIRARLQAISSLLPVHPEPESGG